MLNSTTLTWYMFLRYWQPSSRAWDQEHPRGLFCLSGFQQDSYTVLLSQDFFMLSWDCWAKNQSLISR